MLTAHSFRDFAHDGSVTYRLLAPRGDVAELLGRPIGGDLVLSAWMLSVFDPISDDERFGIVTLDPAAQFDITADAPSTTEADWESLRNHIVANGSKVPADVARVEIRVGAPIDLGDDPDQMFEPAGREGRYVVDQLSKRRHRRAAERDGRIEFTHRQPHDE
jgi:hypothetical protein